MIKLYHNNAIDFLDGVDDNSISCILIDPPYPINTNNGTNRFSQDGWIEGSADHYGPEWYDDFCLVLEQLKRVLKDGRHFYCFVDEKNLFKLKPYLDSYFDFKKVIVWHKKSFGLGYHYRNVIEYCFMYSKGKSYRHIVDEPNFFMDNKDLSIEWHPTVKSLNMCRWLIRNSTDEGDTVLDTFSGSATVAISCMKENRNFIGCEINETYYNKAMQRIKDVQSQLMLL